MVVLVVISAFPIMHLSSTYEDSVLSSSSDQHLGDAGEETFLDDDILNNESIESSNSNLLDGYVLYSSVLISVGDDSYDRYATLYKSETGSDPLDTNYVFKCTTSKVLENSNESISYVYYLTGTITNNKMTLLNAGGFICENSDAVVVIPAQFTIDNSDVCTLSSIGLAFKGNNGGNNYNKCAGIYFDDNSELTFPTGCFRGNNSLKVIRLPEGTTTLSAYMFFETSNVYVILPSTFTTLPTSSGKRYATSSCNISIEFNKNTNFNAIRLSKVINDCSTNFIMPVSAPSEFEDNLVEYFPGSSISYKDMAYKLENDKLIRYVGNATDFVVPDGVSVIGKNAFKDNKDIKTISLTNIVTIEDSAFEGCNALESVEFGENLSVIGNSAFRECNSINSIVLPATISSIGENAFYCKSIGNLGTTTGLKSALNSISFKGSVSSEHELSIGKYAFSGTGITEIALPNSTRSIGSSAFSDCIYLKSIDFGENIQILSSSIFYNCYELDVITLSLKNLQTIDSSCFNGAPLTVNINLTNETSSLTYSKLSLSDVDFLASKNADGTYILHRLLDPTKDYNGIVLTDNISGFGETFKGSNICDITLPTSIVLEDSAFSDCANLKKVTFVKSESSSSLTSIPTTCFSSSSLESIIIPDCVTSIGDQAFFNCKSLKTVSIKSAAELSIGANAFSDCINLSNISFNKNVSLKLHDERCSFLNCGFKSIQLPSNIETLHAEEFSNCNKLTDISIGDSNISDNSKYRAYSGMLFYSENADGNYQIIAYAMGKTDISIPSWATSVYVVKTINEIEHGLFYEAKSLQSITFESGFASDIADYEFYNCTALQKVTFADGSKPGSIGTSAFKNTGISEIIIPASVTCIKEYAFEGCLSLTTVRFSGTPMSLTNIQDYAFKGCNNLREFSIPSSLTTLGENVFMDCVLLKSLSVDTDNQSFSFDESGILIKGGNTIVYILPTSESVTIPAGINSITSDAFYNNNLTSISVDLSNINYSSENNILLSFDKSKIIMVPGALESLAIPSSVTSIVATDDLSPFTYVKSLRSINWSGTSLNLDGNMFVRISTLNSISLNAQEDLSISSQAFIECKNLESIQLKCKKLSLATSSFDNCGYYDLDIMLDCQILSISESAFVNCTGLKSLKITCTNNADISNIFSGTFNDFKITVNNQAISAVETILGHKVSFTFNDNLIGTFSGKIETISTDGKMTFSLISSEGYTYHDLAVSVMGATLTSNQGVYEYKISDDTTFIVDEYSPTESHKVTFDMVLGDIEAVELSIGHGKTILSKNLPNPTNSNFIFVGWYTDNSYTIKYNQSPILNDTILYAKWNLKDGCQVLFDAVHGDITAVTVGGASLSSGDRLESNTSVIFNFNPYVGFELLGWDVTIKGVTTSYPDETLELSVSDDIIVKPNLRYYSSSSSLINITDLKTPLPGDELTKIWTHTTEVDTSMNVWTGFPSVPLIVDNHVYVRINDYIYGFDIYGNGEIDNEFKVMSKTISAYYHYLGYGGGIIFDYATGSAYDLDLTEQYNMITKYNLNITNVSYYDDYFYGLDNTNTLWKFNAKTGALVNDNCWAAGVQTSWHGIYGTMSTPVFAEGHIYFIEASVSSNSRCIGSVDLETGEKSSITLAKLNNKLLDDGWLTYYSYKGAGYLFVTGYEQNLFDSSTGDSAIIDCVSLSEGGIFVPESERWIKTDAGVNGTASAFVVYNGRGYVNVTGNLGSSSASAQFYVYNVNEMLETPIEKWKDSTFENAQNNFLIYQEDSVKSHGSIVVSTAYYEDTGKVYIYLIPYEASEQAVYIFEDYVSKTSPNKYYSSSKIGSAYCSQAIRVGMDGQLIWYNDSGTLYCYGASDINNYYFMIQENGVSKWISLSGIDPIDALNKDNQFNISDGVVSVDGSNYYIQCYIGGKWSSLPRLGLSGFDQYHYYILSPEAINSDTYWYYESEGLLLKCKSDGIFNDKSLIGKELLLNPFPLHIKCTTDANSIKIEVNVEKSLPDLIGYDSPVITVHVKFADDTTIYSYVESLQFNSSNNDAISYVFEHGSSSTAPSQYSVSVYDGWPDYGSNAVCLNEITKSI